VSTGPPGLGRALNLPRGVVILDVGRGSPAARAGLEAFRRERNGEIVQGDVITAIDNEPVATLDDLLEQLERRAPGESVTLTLWRSGQTRKQSVTLGSSE
jgi:S1-C subfamily serine protease